MKIVCAFIHFFTLIIIFLCIFLFNFVENKKLQKSFEEIFGDGWHLREMGEKEKGEEEANLAQPMARENEQNSGEPLNVQMIDADGSATTKSDQNNGKENNFENDQQQKREIVRKFRAIKEKIKKQSEVTISNKQWAKIECEIAKELGTYRTNIYQWIKELGMGKKKKLIITDAQKRKIVVKFKALRGQIGQQKVDNWPSEQWIEIEILLAKKLGTYRNKIYKWARELGMGQQRTNDERRAIMRQYWEMKRNNSTISDRKIAKALQISRDSIRRWKCQFEEEMKSQLAADEDERKSEGMCQKRTNAERMTIIRKYWAMKQNNPKMSDAKIAKVLKISVRSQRNWKCQFKELGMQTKKQLNVITDEQKRAIVREFQKIKQKIKQKKRKFSKEQWAKMDILLAKKLGTYRTQIYTWIKELGLGQKTTRRRWEVIKKYWEMKRNNPKMSDRKISNALKIGRDSIRRWKGQVGEGGEDAF